jgi:phosphatidylserine/phosphatidylglycerophosphate/cardiolipin synthase-like enzyme
LKALAMTARLSAVAAVSHRAPTTVLQPALVDKQSPAAASAIGRALSRPDVMAYVLTDRTVFGAFEEAARRGVKVRIWRDARMAAESCT